VNGDFGIKGFTNNDNERIQQERTNMRKLTLGLALLTSILGVSAAHASDCYSVRVSGCGKKARICVATSSSSTAETKAVEAFKRAYNCSSASVSSYSSSCSEAANDKCDLRQ
jgi:hypothetical protein